MPKRKGKEMIVSLKKRLPFPGERNISSLPVPASSSYDLETTKIYLS